MVEADVDLKHQRQNRDGKIVPFVTRIVTLTIDPKRMNVAQS
jgi:hypothetical protein